jgi:thiol:disulfide interchange protein DsbD
VPVTQPHVTAELIPESTTVEEGKPFDVALHLHMDDGWHTYWVNPGDAGLATTIAWTLPPGFTAGPIQWPTPEKHPMGPLMTYGYAGDVYLLTTITPPKSDLPQHFDIKAKTEWLACQEECVPGKAELTMTLDSGFMNLRLPKENTELFTEARKRLPAMNFWDVQATYAKPPAFPGTGSAQEGILITFKSTETVGVPEITVPSNLRFFPEQPNVLSTQDPDNLPPLDYKDCFTLPIALQQNGDKPSHLSGVLVSSDYFTHQTDFRGPSVVPGAKANAIYISDFTVLPDNSSVSATTNSAPVTNAASATETSPTANATSSEPVAGPATATIPPAAQRAAATQPLLIAVLGAAFVGGLILNLMPCVLPVLSLKVFSLIRHAGDNPKAAWVQGVAFTAGVVLSFWALAGALLALRAAGNQLGWGFQMQSPGFVAALIVLFFLIGLNLFGVFEIGSSLVGLDAKASSHVGGSVSSFLNGALATVAATPCTAPFMGSALGFAAQQPAFISLLVFTFLALGMATPYLLLTLFPATLRFVPKPGAWMESLKQFMGFLLMGTVIFLGYVFTSLTYQENAPLLLFALLMVAMAAWIYGKWGGPINSIVVRAVSILLALVLLSLAIYFTTTLIYPKMRGLADARNQDGWQPWSPEAVDAELAQGKPVFVDFTAAWCLSCKVNEEVALDTDAVKKAFADKNVALFRADWTHSDSRISQTLQQYHRDGVPLYLLYSPNAKDSPQVLPAVLTPGIVLDALNKI